MENYYNGSTWNKWDLHIHTPLSIEQHYGGNTPEVWERFISDLEALPQYYKVLGINDYFTIEGFKKLLEYQKSGRLEGRILFPVIELRVKAFGNLSGGDVWKRVNLHVIFNNNDIQNIESQFLNLLPIDYTSFRKVGLNEKHLIEFGQAVIDNTPIDKRTTNSARTIGFHNLNFDHRQVVNLLKESGIDYFVAVGKTEWEAMRWDGSTTEKKDVIERSHFIFTASESIERYRKASTGLAGQGIPNILLDCSDAHSFSDRKDTNQNPINTRIGNCFSWIKADTNFEGLRQICHEPNSRLRVSETEPTTPPLKINSISLKFPDETKILRKEDKNKSGKSSDFCLSGEITITFSPYFTCLIGGRGAGKSTILNIIAKQLGNKTEFFDKNELMLEGKTINFNEYVVVDGTTNEFEFISQNQVESFAESEELTEAIYERLNEQELVIKEQQIASNIQLITKQVKDINDYENNQNEVTKIQIDLTQKRKLVQAFSSSDYTQIIDSTNKTNDAISVINESKRKYEDLREALVNLCLLNENNFSDNPVNQYDEEFNLILKSILELGTRETDFDKTEKTLLSLEKSKATLQESLNQYYINQGVTPEQINIYNSAVNQIPILEIKIEEINKQQDFLSKSIENYTVISQQFEHHKVDYENKIKDALTPLNEKLKISNPNLANIKFEYEFNQEKAKDKLFDEFEVIFKFQASQSNTKRESVKDNLFCVEPLSVNNLTEYLEELEKKADTNAKSYLTTLFEKEIHFETYKLLIQKVYSDVNQFKKIIGFYGGKELKNCSFGQRCTAVIVALLMFGNKPLIIDEPEAHLDSKLIAEYLVDLIKQRKHERQIIFATHNANFVVNGDAELIQILEVSNNNRTKITATSIENLRHRDKLLALEGGKDAFEKRDKKLLRRA